MTVGTRSALLLHGLGGSGATWWRVAAALRDACWYVETPDLRGHGTATRDDAYPITGHVTDVLSRRPPGDGSWSLVVGHSLGGAVAVAAAAAEPEWADRVALLDPALHIPADEWTDVRASEIDELRTATAESIAVAAPHWHERDRAEKLAAAAAADPSVVERTFDANDPWDVRGAAASVSVPALVLAGDPHVYSMIGLALAAELLGANPRIRYLPVLGAGHSPHRDRPEETIAALLAWAQADSTA